MLADVPLPGVVAVLVGASLVVMVAGPRMATIADRLADVTGLGEAFVGAVLVGAATSLPDLIATVSPALAGLPGQAAGNALGGVMAQTLFLAVADLAYRRANLEHAAASLPNILQATLLIVLMGLVGVAFALPGLAVGGVHVVTVLLPVVYWYGMRLASQAGENPMWLPERTSETLVDEPVVEEEAGRGTRQLVGRFLVVGAALVGSGWLAAQSGEAIVRSTGVSEAAVGVLLTGVSSSLAELVVAVAAVRRGALTLAVANVIGGNTFDTLLVGVADVAYRDGSVYAAAGDRLGAAVLVVIVMTAVLLLGLLRRQRHGPGNVGVEGVVVVALYAVAALAVL